MFYDDYDPTREELEDGFRVSDDGGCLICIFCGERFNIGEIYSFERKLFDARRAAQRHISVKHVSVFDALAAAGKKTHGLSDVQKELMSLFYNRVSDGEIAKITKTSPSTVRTQRFALREKVRQARVFLAMFELMEKNARALPKTDLHFGATMVDDRYLITGDERDSVIKAHVLSADPLVLRSFPVKQKKKLVVLRMIAETFDFGREYDEAQMNAALKRIYDDHATLRRYLIEYGFFERAADGSRYLRRHPDF